MASAKRSGKPRHRSTHPDLQQEDQRRPCSALFVQLQRVERMPAGDRVKVGPILKSGIGSLVDYRRRPEFDAVSRRRRLDRADITTNAWAVFATDKALSFETILLATECDGVTVMRRRAF